MCGIAGLLGGGRTDLAMIAGMTERIAHRGPDDEGSWIDREAGVALGHRRLAIVDLSPAGHQPMVSADRRFVLVYNGEIYNHRAIRAALDRDGLAPDGGWRGNSDTETLLQSIATRGLKASLEQAVGMFAFALWDRRNRRLNLVRDRFGEKPLYYGWVAGGFGFASELKSLTGLPGFDNPIDPEAVATFAARTYIPAPLSIYQGIFKLLPGTVLEIDGSAVGKAPQRPLAPGDSAEGMRASRYWSYADVVDRGLADPITDERDAMAQLRAALTNAVAGQAMADVPIGAFLSGGIDSSMITALYQRQASVPVRSFTIGFHEDGYDEAAHARRVANYLGTEHHEHYLSVDEATGIIPKLPQMYDEPFADSSQIPTYLVSRFARQKVTVAISGDGGDELLGGYSRYGDALRVWKSLKHIPRPLRAALAAPLGAIPPSLWDRAGAMLGHPSHRRFSSRVQKGLRVAGAARGFDDVFSSTLHQWAFEDAPAGSGRLSGAAFDYGNDWPEAVRAMYGDAVAYLPDDILCKVDRASMAVSLETRAPFLDHRVAEVAARIPVSMKIQSGTGKAILRKLLAEELPRDLFERPKSGFGLPLGEWLRGPLRDWAEALLDPRRLADDGWFDARIVRARWDDHLSGRRNSAEAMWAILMFQAWMRFSSGVGPAL